MRKWVLAIAALLLSANAARAALVLHVPNVTATPGSSGSFEVWVEETGGSQFSIQAATVGIKLSASGTVTFPTSGGVAATDAGGAHPPLLTNAPAYSNGTTNAPGYLAGKDIAANVEALSAAPVENGSADGLFSISYTVAPDAVPGTVLTMTVDQQGENTLISDALSEAIVYQLATPTSSFTIVAVPEPAALGLALLGLPLFMRRRK